MLLTGSKALHELDTVDWRACSQCVKRKGGLVTGKGRANCARASPDGNEG